MAGNSTINKKALYFSDRVKDTFSSFPEYPCTVVEAPIGYGKTTMVNEALGLTDADVIWQKVYERSASEFWEGFCQAVSRIDQKCGAGLQNIGMLENSLMRRELMQLMDSIDLKRKTFIVIDDYHLVKSSTVDDFLRLLILNMPENLHLIILTRVAFLDDSSELQLKGLINNIGTKTLKFSCEDIKGYFRLLGINLNKEEQEQLQEYSEGWISALYMLSMEHKINGSFVFTRNVPELVYQTIYRPLDDELKNFLVSICLFNGFSLEQVQHIWEKENTKYLLDRLLSSNSFITRDKVTGEYSLHNIFSICVREQFKLLPVEAQRAIWRKTGEVHYNSHQYAHAMECFYNAKHFDGVLDTLEGGDRARSIQNEHKDLMIKCYDECPEEAKNRHPQAILFFAMEFLTQFREPELFKKACRDFHICIEQNKALSNDERDQLLGEYEILQTFPSYNDLIKMSECNARAAKLLKRPPMFINTKNSFMFSSPSMLYLYYRESGKLAELIEFLRSSPSYYASNTSGHGQSFRPLMEAEWWYCMSDMENAEIAVHKAIPMAKEAGQCDIVLAGMFLQARIALYRSEYDKIIEFLRNMDELVRHEVRNYNAFWMVYTFDLCKAYIYTCLESLQHVPEWIFEYQYPKHMHFMSIAYANLVYGKALLLKGENLQVIGLSEQFTRQAAIFPNLLAVVATDIYSAAAYYRLNRMTDCEEALKKALDAAMPDNLVMLFVENAKVLLPVLDKLAGDTKYTDFIKKIKKTYDKYAESIQKIRSNYFEGATPQLTEREKQIALLVTEGMNNKEIAAELFISPNTVKLELKNIFRKLNINSRILLKKNMII